MIMSENFRDIKKIAQAFFATHPLTDELESMIALFILTIKSTNLIMLSRLETLQASLTDLGIFKFMQNQFYRDLEYSQLLFRCTKWTVNPLVYPNLMLLGQKLWQESDVLNYLNTFTESTIRFFRYLAFSHALKSELRFIPLFPLDTKLNTPFLQTLYEIELDNNRSIQAQIILLKHIEVPGLSIGDKEKMMSDERLFVKKYFCDFLSKLMEKKS